MPKFNELKVVDLRRMLQNREDPEGFEFEPSDFEGLKKDLEAKTEQNSMQLKTGIENNTFNLKANMKAEMEANSRSRDRE